MEISLETRQIAGHQGWCCRQVRRMYQRLAQPPLPSCHAYAVLLGDNDQENEITMFWGVARWINKCSPGITDPQILMDHYPILALAAPDSKKNKDLITLAKQRGVPDCCFSISAVAPPIVFFGKRSSIEDQLTQIVRRVGGRLPLRDLSIVVGVSLRRAGEARWLMTRIRAVHGLTLIIDPLPLTYLE